MTGDAEVGNDDFAGDAVFKGLAIGTADVGDGAQQYLYATDFHNGRIDVFDRTSRAGWTGAFHDPELPSGFAPFGIQTLNGMVFVTMRGPSRAATTSGRIRPRLGRLLRDRRHLPRARRDPRQAGRAVGLAWAPSDSAASATT